MKNGTLALQWPSWANKSLVKVGQACLRFDPKERPGFKGLRSALAKISARLDQKIAQLGKPLAGAGAGAGKSGAGSSGAETSAVNVCAQTQ